MELVNRHHETQKLIARNVVAELHPLWGILSFHELKSTTPDWLRASRPVVEKGYLVSQYVAAEFVRDYRSSLFPNVDRLDFDLPNPLGAFTTPALPKGHGVRIMASLMATGPVHVSELMPMEESEAMAAGFSKMSGAVIRHVLNGGRGMVRLLADLDPLAVGVAGVADNDEGTCKSCAFLTNPIMKADSTPRQMDAVAVGHDFCGCSARLVY